MAGVLCSRSAAVGDGADGRLFGLHRPLEGRPRSPAQVRKVFAVTIGAAHPGDIVVDAVELTGGAPLRVDPVQQSAPGRSSSRLQDLQQPAVRQAAAHLAPALGGEVQADTPLRPAAHGGASGWSRRNCRSARHIRGCPIRSDSRSIRATAAAMAKVTSPASAVRSRADAAAQAGQGRAEGGKAGQTSCRACPRSSRGDSGTACARARPGRWPAGARSAAGRSRRSIGRRHGQPVQPLALRRIVGSACRRARYR